MTFVLHFMYICSTNDYDCHTYVIQNNKAMKKEGKRMYSYRVPESLYDEIDRMVKLRINEYERELLTGVKTESELFKPKKLAQQYNAKDYDLSDAWSQYKKANWYESESIDVEKVLWERFQIIQGNEKKSNPTDDSIDKANAQQSEYNNLQTAKEIASKITVIPIEKHGESEKDIVGVGKLQTVVSDLKKEKVKTLQEMADLIKNGNGPKTASFTTVKKPIDEIYDCVIVERGIPQEADRVYYGSNNRIAFWDRDDATVFYVNWEGKYYRFVTSSQFNKFCKDNNLK